MKKDLQDIINSVIIDRKDKYELLCIKLDNNGYFLESGFIRKYYIENKNNRQIQIELYLNSSRTFFRLKKKIKQYMTLCH